MEKSHQRSKASFEQYLWNQINPIAQYNKLGIEKINSVKKFANQYTKVVNKFAKDLKELGSNFH